MVKNQITITGPNSLADPVGAARLQHEQADQDDQRQRHDQRLEPCIAVLRPSTALSTEIAGVSMPSP